MSKFILRRVSSGFKFDLTAANGQTILHSEVYASRAAALWGLPASKAAPVLPGWKTGRRRAGHRFPIPGLRCIWTGQGSTASG